MPEKDIKVNVFLKYFTQHINALGLFYLLSNVSFDKSFIKNNEYQKNKRILSLR